VTVVEATTVVDGVVGGRVVTPTVVVGCGVVVVAAAVCIK